MGHARPSATTPSVAPIVQTAAFDVPDADVLQRMIAGDAHGQIYTRDGNPSHEALADSIARLEGAEAGTVYASGMGAISSVFLALTSSGDHLILSRSLYGRTLQLAERMKQQFGLAISYVDPQQPQQFADAVNQRTRFALVETVANPLLEVTDVREVARALQDVPLVVDATFTTPELSQPCREGAAITLHSATKYLNGHGDATIGVAAGPKSLMKRLSETASIFGLNANPFEAWLCQRGLRTLPLRMRQICETTMSLAQFLTTHPAVRAVYYPLLPQHPSYVVAQRLYPRGTGGIISFELNGNGLDAVNAFMRSLPEIPFSPSLADARTTISWPAGTSHRTLSSAERQSLGISDELIRLSVGLEPYELLRSELQCSLDSLATQP